MIGHLGIPLEMKCSSTARVCVCLTHSLTHNTLIQVEEMKGRVIRLKMINAPFCPSWHLEHICPAGTRTDMVPASGIKLPFALSPEAAGKGSFPAASTASSSNPPPRVAQSGPTSELSTLSRDDIYDVEMACYLFSVQRDCSSSDSSLSLSLSQICLCPTLLSSAFNFLLFRSFFFCLSGFSIFSNIPCALCKFSEFILLLMHRLTCSLRALKCTCERS